VWSDDFNRAASTNIGADWNEAIGDWEIIGDAYAGWLHEKAGTTPGTEGTAGSKVFGTNPVPVRSAGEMICNVSIVDPVIGDSFYLYVACDGAGSGGDWVSYTYTAVDTWLVTLSTGESKTQVWTPIEPLPTTTPVVACKDSDGFLYGAIASSGDEFPWNDGDAVGDGRYYGLGHDNVSTGAVFDDFQVRELRTSTQDCVSCFCHCGSLSARNNVQKTLLLTIFDAIDRAACMDGRYVTMTWEWNSGVPRWVSEVMRVYSTTSGSSNYCDFRWYLECGTHDPADPFAHFSLNWFPGYKNCCSGNSAGCDGVYYPDELASTCTPLSLVFGPFALSVGELTCHACYDAGDPMPPTPPMTGEYYIAITESP
jgi:hypothetical protein